MQAQAAVHGYTVALWWAAGVLALGAILTALRFRQRKEAAEETAIASDSAPDATG